MSELAYNKQLDNEFFDDDFSSNLDMQWENSAPIFPQILRCTSPDLESKFPECGPCFMAQNQNEYLDCELWQNFERWARGKGNRTKNNRKIIGRFQRLRRYLGSPYVEDAQTLFDQIENMHSIGLLFHQRLSRAGVVELKRILRLKIEKELRNRDPGNSGHTDPERRSAQEFLKELRPPVYEYANYLQNVIDEISELRKKRYTQGRMIRGRRQPRSENQEITAKIIFKVKILGQTTFNTVSKAARKFKSLPDDSSIKENWKTLQRSLRPIYSFKATPITSDEIDAAINDATRLQNEIRNLALVYL